MLEPAARAQVMAATDPADCRPSQRVFVHPFAKMALDQQLQQSRHEIDGKTPLRPDPRFFFPNPAALSMALQQQIYSQLAFFRPPFGYFAPHAPLPPRAYPKDPGSPTKSTASSPDATTADGKKEKFDYSRLAEEILKEQEVSIKFSSFCVKIVQFLTLKIGVDYFFKAFFFLSFILKYWLWAFNFYLKSIFNFNFDFWFFDF